MFEIFYLALLILTSIVYIWSIIFFRLNEKTNIKDTRSWYTIILEILIFVLFAPFIEIFANMSFIYLIFKIYTYLLKGNFKSNKLNIKNERENKTKTSSVKIKLILKYFFGLITHLGALFLILVYLVAIFSKIIAINWFNIVTIAVGFIIPIIFFINNRVEGLPLFNENMDVKLRTIIEVFLVLTIFVGSNILYANINNRAIPNSSEKFKLSVMTYNILYAGADGTLKNWDERKSFLSDQIEDINPDIFGTQEGYPIQLNYLNETLNNRNYTWYGVGRNGPQSEYNAIFYDMDKFVLLENNTFWLSETPNSPGPGYGEKYPRICSYVKLMEKISSKIFYFFNTHFGFYPEFHIRASIQLNNYIAHRTGDNPIILTGDFNMPNFFPFYQYLEGFGNKPLKEAYRITHNYVNPFDSTTASSMYINSFGMQIDYIFTSSNVNILKCSIIRETYDGIHTPSDHYPKAMECEIDYN